MNYEQAEIIMEQHMGNVLDKKGAMAKHSPTSKKLDSCAWLRHALVARDGLPEVTDVAYQITLFGSNGNIILSFHPDYVLLDDHGWFGKTTHAKLNEYMPAGFRVWGTKYNHLSNPRPLGFIKTPAGVFPYSMPMRFSYSGVPIGSRIHGADALIERLPSYVAEYINQLLKGPPYEELELPLLGIHTNLAENAVESENLNYMGLSIQEIVGVVRQEGAKAFAKVSGARHMERLLFHGVPIPVIKKNWLRQTLRPLIHDYLIDSMGFADVCWNRR